MRNKNYQGPHHVHQHQEHRNNRITNTKCQDQHKPHQIFQEHLGGVHYELAEESSFLLHT